MSFRTFHSFLPDGIPSSYPSLVEPYIMPHIPQKATAKTVQEIAGLSDAGWGHFLRGSTDAGKDIKRQYQSINSWPEMPENGKKKVKEYIEDYLRKKDVPSHSVDNYVLNWRMPVVFHAMKRAQKSAEISGSSGEGPGLGAGAGEVGKEAGVESSTPVRTTAFDPIRHVD